MQEEDEKRFLVTVIKVSRLFLNTILANLVLNKLWFKQIYRAQLESDIGTSY